MWKNGTGDSDPDSGAPPTIAAATSSTAHGFSESKKSQQDEQSNIDRGNLLADISVTVATWG
jgi:hypothetical protein